MTLCGACDSKIQDLNFMECSNSKCALLFCLLCINKSQEEFNQLTYYFQADWFCPQCISKIPKGDHTPVRSVTGSQLNDTFTKNINITRGFRSNPKACELKLDLKNGIDEGSKISLLVEEIRHLRCEVKDIIDSNLELKSSMHKIESLLTLTSNKLADESARIGEMKEKIITLQATVSNLHQANAVLEPENIRNEIENIGVPECNDENLGHIMMTACNKIGIKLKEDEIDDIFSGLGLDSEKITTKTACDQ
ncbi:hypothetical protein O0L34_g19320 [Tuta absoluta]|nr:hypothetical protein O0L34_g19320 [Tuta absoluta]